MQCFEVDSLFPRARARGPVEAQTPRPHPRLGRYFHERALVAPLNQKFTVHPPDDPFPRQILLYVGEAPMRMERELRGPDLLFQYRLIDIRTLDGDRLLESEEVGDNVIAILAQLRNHKEAVRRIVERIAGLAMAERETALAQLTILAGLRHLARTVEQETRKMPIDIDIRDHEVLGPYV